VAAAIDVLPSQQAHYFSSTSRSRPTHLSTHSTWPPTMAGSSFHHLPTIDVSALPPSLLGSVPSSSSTSSPGISPSSSSQGGDAPPFPPPLSSLQTEVSNQFSNINQAIIPPTLHVPACMAAGTFSFYSTMALSTLFQGKILRLSTGSMTPVPTIAGIATVAVGGLAAHGTSVVVTALQRNERDKKTRRRAMSSSSWWRQSTQQQTQQAPAFADFMTFDQASQTFQSGIQSIENDVRNFGRALRNDPAHAVRIATLALIAFKVLGGRFWSIPPSSYTSLGSFARVSHSIPAKMNYATSAQRKVIETVGRRWGCHTCGSRMVFARTKPSLSGGATSIVKFHADHMPPRSVVNAMDSRWWRRLLRIQVKQRFYPQCVSCSNVQGSILSKAASRNGAGGILKSKANGARALAASGGGSVAYNHGFRPRFYHITGGLVAVATVADANEDEVVRNGNARRFRMIHAQIDDTFGSVVDFCCDWVDSFQ